MSISRFPKSSRLLRPAEFDRVFKWRCSVSDAFVIAYGAPNDLNHPRLGLTVSRRIGNAVVRNRCKRALREAFRLNQEDLPVLDLVLLPKPGATLDAGRLIETLPKLLRRLERKLAEKRGTAEQAKPTP